MDRAAILLWLSIAAPILALVAGLISQTQKTADTDASGRRRLTGAGRALLGLAVLSTLIAVLALGFGELNKRDADAEAARTKLQETQDKALGLQIAADAKVAASGREQREVLDDLQRASEQQAQKLILLSEFAAAQQRDAQISLQIAREASQRLADAQQTFAEFERVNYPLREIQVVVRTVLPESELVPDFWAKLEKLAAAEELGRLSGLEGMSDGSGRYDTIIPLDPGRMRESALNIATSGMQMALELTEGGRSPRRADDGLTLVAASPNDRELRPLGERIFRMEVLIRSLEANLQKRTLTAVYGGKFEASEAGVLPGGRKTSVGEVKRLTAGLSIRRNPLRDGRQRGPDRLQRVSVRLNGLPYFDFNTMQESPAPRNRWPGYVDGMTYFRLLPAQP